METPESITLLVQWMKSYGGSLHPSVDIAYSADSGVHVRAKADIAPGTCLCTVPHSSAISALNAYVDDGFKQFGLQQHVAVETVGYFYLMYQYINRERSFWKPYLDTLPGLEDAPCTPFWFEDNDVAWLLGTDVHHTMIARKTIHESQFQSGIDSMQKAGHDTRLYTWNLFRWAVTIFTSRSFSSRALHPQDSKYWSAYKSGPQGQRQVVLLDLSRAPAEELDFPVLFPLADAANHKHDAKAEWSFDPGRFSITTKDFVATDAEVFNNYGPKGNAELLLGYGFCIENNPYDSVLLTLKPPPPTLQVNLRQYHPGYFTTSGEWSGEKATFMIRAVPPEASAPTSVFECLPEPLLELMLYMLCHERGLDFEFVEEPIKYFLAENNAGRRFLPFIARMLMQSLAPKLQNFHQLTPSYEPTTKGQVQAKIYRDGQVAILESVVAALRGFMRSLLPESPLGGDHTPHLFTLEQLLELLETREGEKSAENFLLGVAANAGTTDVKQLRLAGWEDDVFILLLCYLWLSASEHEGGAQWVRDMLPEHLVNPSQKSVEPGHSPFMQRGMPLLSEISEQVDDLLNIVHVARQALVGSVWKDSRWETTSIISMAGETFRTTTFTMSLPIQGNGSENQHELRTALYIHSP